TEDQPHRAQLQQDVDHALKAVLVDELAMIAVDRTPQHVGPIRAVAAGEVAHAADREDDAHEQGGSAAHDPAHERYAVQARLCPVARADDDVVTFADHAHHLDDES